MYLHEKALKTLNMEANRNSTGLYQLTTLAQENINTGWTYPSHCIMKYSFVSILTLKSVEALIKLNP